MSFSPILHHSTERYGSWVRLALVLPFVLACYRFGWSTWRAEVCNAFVSLAHLVGMPVLRFSADSFFCGGHVYRFAIACTALDAFFGSIPLLWIVRAPFSRNLLFFARYFAALMVLNMVRLTAGLWIFLHGIPWWLSHEAFAGVFYFCLFLWIARQRGWQAQPSLPVHSFRPA